MALMHVNQAMRWVSNIRGKSTSQAKPLTVSIYTELNSTSLYAPVKRGKPGDMSASRLKRGTNIREVTGEYTRVALNVDSAAQSLEAARAALQNGDFAAADVALAAVQNEVTRTTTTSDLPLLKVRQNLMLARARVEESKYKDAAAPLRAAAEGLAEYQRLNPGPHATEAGLMRQQIQQYARTVGREHSDALDRISDWWEKSTAWFDEMTK
jgi:hypothetical protein